MSDPLDNYDPVTRAGAAYTRGLMKIWEKLGKPSDCSTNTGWIMLDNIIQIWKKAWPWEYKDWQEKLEFELGTERTIKEALNAKGGYFPVSYPTRLYRMIHAILPDQNLVEKKFLKQLVSRYPFLHSSNYKI